MKTLTLLLLTMTCVLSVCLAGDYSSTTPIAQDFSVNAALEINQVQGGSSGFTDQFTVGSYFFDSQSISGTASAQNSTATLQAYPYQDGIRTSDFWIDKQGGIGVSLTDISKLLTITTTSTSCDNQATIDSLAERYGNVTVSAGEDYATTSMNLGSTFAGSVKGDNAAIYGESLNAKEVKVFGNNFYSQSAGSISIKSNP